MPVRYMFEARFLLRSARLSLLCGIVALSAASLCASRSANADAKSALPPAVGDFKLTHPPQTYSPATLENHIDGEAESVKHYDFKECAYGEYAPKGQGNQLITVDVYQMGDATNAYGYYSSQMSATAPLVKIGAQGYQEPTALNFWKGPYYVKVTITASNPAPFQPQMPKIAQAIAAKLSGATTTPEIMKLLPAGYTPRTEKYLPADIAEQSYIRHGASARYPKAGPQAELFVAVYPSPAAAKDAYNKYSKYLSDPTKMAVGAKAAALKGIGDSAIGVRSKYTGEVVAAVKGKYLAGVRKAKDQAGAQTLVKAALEHAK
jgi:hypothetical protein